MNADDASDVKTEIPLDVVRQRVADAGKLSHLHNGHLDHLADHKDDDNHDDGEVCDDDDGVGGDDGGQCVDRHEGQVRSSETAHCSTAT